MGWLPFLIGLEGLTFQKIKCNSLRFSALIYHVRLVRRLTLVIVSEKQCRESENYCNLEDLGTPNICEGHLQRNFNRWNTGISERLRNLKCNRILFVYRNSYLNVLFIDKHCNPLIESLCFWFYPTRQLFELKYLFLSWLIQDLCWWGLSVDISIHIPITIKFYLYF